MSVYFRCFALMLVALAIAPTCEAQIFVRREAPRRGSVELSGGGVYQAGNDLPQQNATLTRNPATGSAPLQLFASDLSLAPALGGQFRLGYYLSSAISIEGGVQLSRPKLEARLSGDFENAPQTIATETVSSYLFTGSLLYHVGRKPLKPFLIAGAGHVRDLHAGEELIETGPEYHFGGGIKSWLGTGRRKFGIRAEALFSMRNGGVGAEDERRNVPTASFSIAYLF